MVLAQTFDPYGKVATSTGAATSPFGFAGQYTDAETGFQYLRARYYDPATAQFVSRDPLTSLTRQPYSYAADDPVNFFDPAGLDKKPPNVDPPCRSSSSSAEGGHPRNPDGTFAPGGPGETAATEAGKSAHKNYPNALGDGYIYNRRLPKGSLDRPDAVNYTDNIVRELKPDSPSAIRAGWRQVNRYKDYLEKHTGQAWTAFVDTYRRPC